MLHPGDEAAGQRRDQDGADQRRAERRAEVLRGALEAAGLVRLRRIDRRHDHVAELGEQQPGADAEDRERDREVRPVELDVDRPEQTIDATRAPADRPARPASARIPPRAAAPASRRGTSSPTSGTAVCRSRRRRGRAPPGGTPAARRTCRAGSAAASSASSARRAAADPEQRAVEQRVPTLPLAALLPQRERGEQAAAGEDQERHDREAERRDLVCRRSSARRAAQRAPLAALEDPEDDQAEAGGREQHADDVELRSLLGRRRAHKVPAQEQDGDRRSRPRPRTRSASSAPS